VFAGSVIWVPPFVLAGYLVGSVPALKEYLPYITPTIILAVTIPAVINIIKGYKKLSKQNNARIGR
jgi:membrane-associated protein